MATGKLANPVPAMSIYPNPAHHEITISSTNKIDAIAITNMIGQVVEYSPQPTTYEREFSLSVASLTAGVYFVRVNGSSMAKFVKD
jgi:hypothetical protein